MNPKPPKVDPSTMQTDAGRDLAHRVNREFDSATTQLHRLKQVLSEFLIFDRSFQCDLAEAANIWAFATLASNDRRDECRANMHAFVDIMYVETSDAETTLSASERNQVAVAADAIQEHLTPGIGEILGESARRLADFPKDHAVRMAADVLHRLRTAYINYVPSDLLGHNILACCAMSANMDAFKRGTGPDTGIMNDIQELVASSVSCSKAVLARVESGELVVRDGTIVDPRATAS